MLATILTLSAALATQTPPPPAPVPAPAEPDVLISVSAHADQVRWRQVGSVRLRAWAEPHGGVLEENLSTGLPRPIPGQRTFRDVTWSLRVGACLTSSGPAAALDPEPQAAEAGPCAAPQSETQTGSHPQ